MWAGLSAIWLAGLGLAALEVAWGLSRGHGLFLSAHERGLFGLAALTGLSTAVLCAGAPFAAATLRSVPGARWRRGLGLGAALLGGALLWQLTAGRTVRDSALRAPLVAVGALLCGLGLWAILGLATRVRGHPDGRARVLFSALGAFLVVGALAADALILPRGYPAFHFGLGLLALLLAAMVGVVWSGALSARSLRVSLGLAGACLLAFPFALLRLDGHGNASFVVSEKAPWTAKLLWGVARLSPDEPAVEPKGAPSPVARAAGPGIDLRDRDLLLITVDALRADMLAAYGGAGVTPQLDRIAAQSAVFLHAYTPAPHTSYALVSLLTGKFIKPVVELHGSSSAHVTLPDLFRRYGYRTAAFYPPAIFFVDGAHFAALRERGFGFEYRKEMYAPAEQRVRQLAQYLDEVDASHPLFVWVHLFEPHEPYVPPADWPRQDTARGRYEGEVAAADRAIGQLVELFRARRTGATVIVSADHGEEFGDHGGAYHGTTLYEEQARIPLLWSSPGVVQPRKLEAPVELLDVGTTLLAAAGIPLSARMRGDDLGPALAGRAGAGPQVAFASVGDLNMVTDGRLKVLCGAQASRCRAFDLAEDPGETRDVSTQRADETRALRAQLSGFLGSVAEREALAVDEGVGFPEALSKARLGAFVETQALLDLLDDEREAVRAEAVRALATRASDAVLADLADLRASDPSPWVRAEALVAALSADPSADDIEAALALLEEGAAFAPPDLKGRAALGLASHGRREALSRVTALALDRQAEEAQRLRAVEALGQLGGAQAGRVLSELLSDARLGAPAAEALTRIGGPEVRDALAHQLARERYQAARSAEATALVRLGDPRAKSLIRKLLGMETSLPGGVSLLLSLGALDRAGALGGRLADPRSRAGDFECDEGGCQPGTAARLVLHHVPAGEVRVTLLVDAAAGASLTVGELGFRLAAGLSQVSWLRDGAASRRLELPVSAAGRVGLVAVVVTKAVAELAPPAPEPWDAGVPDASPQ